MDIHDFWYFIKPLDIKELELRIVERLSSFRDIKL